MKELTYLNHIRSFDNRLSDGQFSNLSAIDIALYKAILAMCNEITIRQFNHFRTEVEFPASRADLMKLSHVGKNTFDNARENLKNAGLIEYKKGYKFGESGGSSASIYMVKYLEQFKPAREKPSRKKQSILSQNRDSDSATILSQNRDSKNFILSQNRDSETGFDYPKFGNLYKKYKESVYREDTHTLFSETIPDPVKPYVDQWCQHLKEKKLTSEQISKQVSDIAEQCKSGKYTPEQISQMIQTALLHKDWVSLKWDTLAKDFTTQNQKPDRITISASNVLN